MVGVGDKQCSACADQLVDPDIGINTRSNEFNDEMLMGIMVRQKERRK